MKSPKLRVTYHKDSPTIATICEGDSGRVANEICTFFNLEWETPARYLPMFLASPDLYAALQAIIAAADSDAASGGEMWYAEAVSPAIESARNALKKAQV